MFAGTLAKLPSATDKLSLLAEKEVFAKKGKIYSVRAKYCWFIKVL